MCSIPYKGKEKYKVKVFVYVKIKKRGTFFKLTTPSYRNPRGTTFCDASRDLLRLALSIISFKSTTPPYRGPDGTSFARPSFDQPLSALSILIVKLTTLAFRNPRGATGAALRVPPFCCSHCRFSKKRGTLFFENSSFVQSCA